MNKAQFVLNLKDELGVFLGNYNLKKNNRKFNCI